LLDFAKFFKDKVILVFGGTGSIGSEITSQLLKFDPKTIRIFSNSENELWETKNALTKYEPKLRFLLGDIRNLERVRRACDGVDYIFNAAAIKHVPFSEYNPMEAINVNIHGLNNIINCALEFKVKKFIHISTDKAVNPTTVMGATKLLGERLCISRELAKGEKPTIISCVRFGNVLGSRGSIIPLLKKQIDTGNKVTLTEEKMKRFFISISQAVELVLKAASIAQGGEIFVLKMPTLVIKDLIEVIIENYAPLIGKNPSDIEIEIIGPRLGEKLDEVLISSIEFPSSYELEDSYIIYPQSNLGYQMELNHIKKQGSKIELNKNFKYSTKNATSLSKPEIKKMLKQLNLL